MEKYQASRNTIRLALAALVNEGLVVTEHGRGTFVRERRALTYHAARAERADRAAGSLTPTRRRSVRPGASRPRY
jgi:GntR family transcriptional regulator